MYRRRYGYRQKFSGSNAITESRIEIKKRSKCKGCGLFIQPGEEAVKLRLKKRFRTACTACGHVPLGSKKFHAACVPSDINVAMGFDPAKNQPPAYQQPKAAAAPKVETYQELSLEALNALEKVLVARIKAVGISDDLRQKFLKYKKIKALALGAKTEGEEAVALRMGLLEAVKLAF